MEEKIQFIKCVNCYNFVHPDSRFCPYCQWKFKSASKFGVFVFVLAVVGVIVIVVMFFANNIGNAKQVEWAAARTLAIADRPNFFEMNQAERDVSIETYHVLLVRSAPKCEYAGISNMTNVIMALGDDMERTDPNIEFPRALAMLMISATKPDDKTCSRFLAELIINAENTR